MKVADFERALSCNETNRKERGSAQLNHARFTFTNGHTIEGLYSSQGNLVYVKTNGEHYWLDVASIVSVTDTGKK